MAGSQRHSIAEQSTENSHVEKRCGRRCEEAVQCFVVLKQWRPPVGSPGTVERKPSTIRASAPLGVYSNNDISRALGETDGFGDDTRDERCRTPSTARGLLQRVDPGPHGAAFRPGIIDHRADLQ